MRIALFAPFEGRYREIGYNALYAARLGLDIDGVTRVFNQGTLHVELLAVDDGGTEAVNRARALAQDPLVLAVIALGYDATTPEVLRAFGDVPVLIVGEWGAERVSDNIFILSNPEIAGQISTSPRISLTDAAELPAPVVGTDVMALEGFVKLRDELDGVTVLSSGMLPDDNIIQLYRDSDAFAPPPGLLASLTFDATQLAALVSQRGERGTATRILSEITLPWRGKSGDIRFENGYWADAPLHRYVYVDGVLTEDAVEQR